MEHRGVGHGGPHPAHVEASPGGVVVVAVGRRHRSEKLSGALLPGVGGQDRRHLNLGVEGDAGDLLLDEEGVVHPLSGLLETVPEPAPGGQGGDDADAHEHGLPGLPRLHPQVAPQRGQGRHSQDGHGHAVGLEGLGLVGVGGVPAVVHRPLVGLLQMGLRPLGSQGAQQQPSHDALPLVQVGQRAQQGDEGV